MRHSPNEFKHPLGIFALVLMARDREEPLVNREKLKSLGPDKIECACDKHSRAAAAATTPQEYERHINLLSECVFTLNCALGNG